MVFPVVRYTVSAAYDYISVLELWNRCRERELCLYLRQEGRG